MSGIIAKIKEQISKMDKHALIGVVAFLMSVLLLFVGIISTTSIDFYDIPVLSLIFGNDSSDLERSKKEIAEEMEYYDELLEDNDELSNRELRLAKKVVRTGKKLSKSFSLGNIKALMKNTEKLAEKSSFGINVLGSEFDEVTKIINIILIVAWIFMLIPLAVTVLGGIKKSVAASVVALILAMIFFLLFGGILWGLLSAASYVTQAVCYKRMKAAKAV
ncbi:MAG: hypothetical protein IJE24_01155 [Oscillospiraceae bacterium]|nr:hypothetical protein [Oscillospiraceae bacterium]